MYTPTLNELILNRLTLWHIGCKSICAIIALHSSLKTYIMIALSQILRSLFTSEDIKPSVTTIETPQNPVHEKDVYQGIEFLDDPIRMEDAPEDEMNNQNP